MFNKIFRVKIMKEDKCVSNQNECEDFEKSELKIKKSEEYLLTLLAKLIVDIIILNEEL